MKKYEVTGPRLVRGRAKGETLEHEFTPKQEAALIAGAHIKPSAKGGKKPSAKGDGEKDSAEATSPPSLSPPKQDEGAAATPTTDKE